MGFMTKLELTFVHDFSASGHDEGYAVHFKRGWQTHVFGEMTKADIYALRDACIDALDDIDRGRL